MERLQKFIAAAGVASRRKAEALILAGKVSINGQVVKRLGVTVQPGEIVSVNGEVIKTQPNLVYYALNKPRGVITTSSDEQGRKTVLDLVPKNPRVVVCGRLDAASRGLVLLTNDGACCQAITHPSFDHTKEYRVLCTINKGPTIEERLKKIEQGIKLDDKLTAPVKISAVKRQGMKISFELVLNEGRNRQIRRMCSAVGFDVEDLVRIRIGNLLLGDLPEGRWRLIKKSEVLG